MVPTARNINYEKQKLIVIESCRVTMATCLIEEKKTEQKVIDVVSILLKAHKM